ncbi:hypothetical protein R16034_04932 [Ralstonia edaphis]|uniref:Abortive phage infection protein C-terminal domain-containing protein n=1 Tax=Ralstonia edaphi TaxID=3058599 RepID=A0AB72XCH2_9RALS|nr:AIPR family protein [Ralstonia sp. LMG 6871]CAJ0744904.1 hypothetical protein R16034_04932 [Ralstonia sp. LMG 6871]
MAKNDSILIDGIIDDRLSRKIPSEKRDEVFEYFSIEQILKNWDLSADELKSGWVDGRGDGGIDAFHIFVNGHLLQEVEQFTWPKTSADLFVSVISCKHHETFKLATLDSMAASLLEIFDFSIKNEDLSLKYNSDLISQRNNLRFAYQKLASSLTKMQVDVVYASRGDTTDMGEEVTSRAEQIKKIISESFTKSGASFRFLGSAELIELYRKRPNYSLELKFIQELSRGETYVVLANLRDYFHFISDEEGSLRRYLFESNVRDFVGLNRVNEDIKITLDNADSPDFWWLNNGVTILATGASVIGDSIHMQDIQIVNGLQTTESIYRYFRGAPRQMEDRAVMVKVIVSKEDSVRDSIVRATNNQTSVEQISLHATDRIQRSIEEILYRHGIYYDRRKNFYANQGHSSGDIVSPLYLAAGYVALLLKLPYQATHLRQKHLRPQEAYDLVFSEKTPLEVYPIIVRVLRKADEFLESNRPARGGSAERFLKNNRYILSLSALARHFGTFSFSVNNFLHLDVDSINENAFKEIWDIRNDSIATGADWTNKQGISKFFKKIGEQFGIKDVLRIVNGADPLRAVQRKNVERGGKRMDIEFALKVKDLLPEQPWKPGMHKDLCSALNCTHTELFSAVEMLIDEGLVNRQTDGVVYDADGNVLMFDADRVDPNTLELRDAQP